MLVFIDDLDRTDPKLVPTLLLALRDLLDPPGFCFFLAFDEIVAESLKQVNTAWGDGKAFLDKILDFSFSLPKATFEQRLSLFEYHLEELCPWMNLNIVQQNSDLLSETPRKLKLLLRNLMTLRPLMERHDKAEIQWIDFLFGQLLRLGAPTFIDKFLRNGNDRLVEVGANIRSDKDQLPFERRLDIAVSECGIHDEGLRAHLVNLISSWSERRVWVESKPLAYYAGFGSTHREIT